MPAQVSVYLATLHQNLKSLPIHERLEQLDEAQAHLEGLTETFQREGLERSVAETQAIAQFGDVHTIALQLTRAATKRRWGHLLGVAAIYLGITNVCATALHALLSLGVAFNKELLLRPLPIGNTSLWSLCFVLITILTSLVAGALLRRLAPGNTLRPLLLVAAVSMVLSLCFPTPTGIPVVAYGIGGILLSFLVSGALEELPEELLRLRRRVA